jgi:hypothetical protein
MKVIGIDPGAKGAFAIVDHGRLTLTETLPKTCGELSIKRFVKRLRELSMGVDYVLIEKVHSIPGASSKSTFQFGVNVGFCTFAAQMADLPIEYVEPKKWQKHYFHGAVRLFKKGTDKVDTKAMAAREARELFPDHNFFLTTRATKPHDGLVDAALIAYYGSTFKRVTKKEA